MNDIEKKIKEIEAELSESRVKQREILNVSDNEISRVVEATIGELDHFIDISKFFISLSSTAVLAVIGLPNVVDRSSLVFISFPVFVFSLTFLVIKMKERKKLIKRYTDFYAKTRLKAFSSILGFKD